MKNEMGSKDLQDSEAFVTNPIFVAPKIYGFITPTGKTVIKFKGVDARTAVTMEDQKLLLKGVPFHTTLVERMKFSLLDIYVHNFKAVVTGIQNKRRVDIFAEDGSWFSTIPLVLDQKEPTPIFSRVNKEQFKILIKLRKLYHGY